MVRPTGNVQAGFLDTVLGHRLGHPLQLDVFSNHIFVTFTITIMKFYETIWSYSVSNFQKWYACTHSFGYYTWKSCLKSAMSKSLKWFSNFIDWDSSAVPAVHGNVGIFQCGHINTSHPLDSVTCAWLLETCLWNWVSLWRPCCPNLWNFPTLAHSNRKIKAKWRPITKMLKHF